MKIKLLKKLRKLFELQERNNEFRVFENEECSGNIYNKTNWTSKSEAINIRRNWILEKAEHYRKPKKLI